MITDSTVNAVDTGLEIAGAMSSALAPPWDAVAETTTEVIGDVLDLFFGNADSPGSSPLTLTQIIDALSVQSTMDAIHNANSAITSTATLFAAKAQGSTDPLPSSIKSALQNDPFGAFSRLYKFVGDIVSGINQQALVEPITSMVSDTGGDICSTDTNIQAAYLPTFAYGVSTYLMLAIYWASLTASVDGAAAAKDLGMSAAIDLFTTAEVNGQPTGWIGYASSVCDAFEQQVQSRVSQVTPATPVSFPDGLFDTVTFYAIYFADSGEAVANFNYNQIRAIPPWPGTVGPTGDTLASKWDAVYALGTDNSPQQDAPVYALRDDYVGLMQQSIYNNYFDPNAMRVQIQKWQAGITRLLTT